MSEALVQQSFDQISSVKQGILGARQELSDGRVWRYGLAGATALAAGKLAQAPLGVANHQALVVTAAQAVGDQSITVTLGGTAVTANQYQDGYVVIYDVAGQGQALRIANHPAQATTTGNVTLNLAEPFRTAITTSTTASLAYSPYSSLIIQDHTATTGAVAGVPKLSVTAAYYGWFQRVGVASVLTNGTPAAGAGVIASATTDGAVDVEAATTVTGRLGIVLGVAGVSTKYNSILLGISN